MAKDLAYGGIANTLGPRSFAGKAAAGDTNTYFSSRWLLRVLLFWWGV